MWIHLLLWFNIHEKKVKVKVTLVQALRLCTGRTAHRGSRGIVLLFHDDGNRRGWGVSVTPRPLFTLGKDPVQIVQRGWVDPRAGLERCGKSRPPPGFDSQTVQPVGSHYTDYDFRVLKLMILLDFNFWLLFRFFEIFYFWVTCRTIYRFFGSLVYVKYHKVYLVLGMKL